MSLIKEFPFTFLLALVGFLIGSLFLSSSNLLNYNFSLISLEQPLDIFADYFGSTLRYYIYSILCGLSGGLILGFVGFVIDFIKRRSDF